MYQETESETVNETIILLHISSSMRSTCSNTYIIFLFGIYK